MKKFKAVLAKKNRGQAALWALALFASMTMVFVGVYSVGQVTSEKQKISNAVDAAAYSGGLVQARALNMMAYANRAQIANEVLIAQAVSLESWLVYSEQAVENARTIADILSAIPFVNFVAIPLARVLSAAEQVLQVAISGSEIVTDGTILAAELAYEGLDLAAAAVFFPGAMTVAANDAANAVLAQNYLQRAGSTDSAPTGLNNAALGALNALEWNGAFAKYTEGKQVAGASDGRQTAKDILLHSRDAFSTARVGPSGPLSYIFGNGEIGNCVTGSIGSSRDGPTELKDFDRWEAQDTSEFQYRAPGQCKGKATSMPVGWGRATAADEQTRGDQKINPHRITGSLAYSDMDSGQQHSNWSGVKELYDVERDTGNGRPIARHTDEKLVFHYAAKKNRNQVRTNEALGFYDTNSSAANLGNTRLPTVIKEQGGEPSIASIAAAKVFFSRPVRNGLDFTGIGLQRGDAHKEVSSLYNPYWQVRLTKPDALALGYVYGGLQAVFSQSSGLPLQ